MAEPRERWRSRPVFVMAAIGSAVGLGNIWRFPYIAGKYGGGAFLIPYFIAMLTAGVPLVVLEYGLGQYFQSGAPGAMRKINKRFEWVGWWALLVGTCISFYYAVILAWCWNYLYFSFKLAWQPDAEAFFEQFTSLGSKGPWDFKGISWPIVVGLALTWIAVYLIIRKGVKNVGRVVMVTVPLPLILLVILLIRGMTLPGWSEGVKYYLTPRWEEFLKPDVWLAAYGQVFFSLSLGFGILIAYASYEASNAEITNNAFITSLANCGTSFFAGLVVFSTVGFLAQDQGKAVADIAASGGGLAFITYPSAISRMPLASLVGVLFFIALLTLGIDSLFSLVEAAVAGIQDKWRVSRAKVTVSLCVLGFLVGLLYCTGAGSTWLDIVDHWMNKYGLALVGLAECLIVAYAFNTRVFVRYIDSVSEIKLKYWWQICIRIVTPTILGASVVVDVVGKVNGWVKKGDIYGGYPVAAVLLGLGLAATLVVVSLVLMRLKGRKEVHGPADEVS